ARAESGSTPRAAESPPHGQPVLQARGLQAGYPGMGKVFSSLDLDLVRGEVLAVIGPNGSGKTTLFRVLSGELAPLAGEVLVEGRGSRGSAGGRAWSSVARLRPRERARLVARVLQSEQPAWAVPVADYVEAGLFASEGWFSHDPARASAMVSWALDSVGISQLAARPVTELSGGEFRRVVIARALAQDTDVLLLDEPTADLDLAHQMETLELLHDLARGGKAVAFSVHDLNQAAMAADRVLLLAQGGAAAFGTPSQVLTPGRIEEAYGAAVVSAKHPRLDLPLIVPDPYWK
ncbi:MAG TPA: ABC transporter ATP-binding protein, partial [Rectinemataceae bacterium]